MNLTPPRLVRLFELTIPWIVLIILLFYTFGYFFRLPYTGFEFTVRIVTRNFINSSSSDILRPGDELIQVGNVVWKDFEKDFRINPLKQFTTQKTVPIWVKRNSEVRIINWVVPGFNRPELNARLKNIWWISYIFWMAASAAKIFIRPKDVRWLILVLFLYVCSIWLAAGAGPSHWHLNYSPFVLKIGIWLSIFLFVHFHWIYPRQIFRFPSWVSFLYYGGAFLICVGEVLQIVPQPAYQMAFLSAVPLILIFMILHYIFHPAFRKQVSVLLLGPTIVLAPVIILNLRIINDVAADRLLQSTSMLSMVALPGIYFYTLYLRQFKHLERRTIRLVLIYFAAALFAIGNILFLNFVEYKYGLSVAHRMLADSNLVLSIAIALISFFPFVALPTASDAIPHRSVRVSQLQLRANRRISIYLFALLIGGGVVFLVIVADFWLIFPGEATFMSLFAAIMACIVTALWLTPFQRVVENRLLGIPVPPARILESYSSRITTSLDLERLNSLLRNEIFPSLLIRKAALIGYSQTKTVRPLMTLNLEPDQLPTDKEIPSLLERAGVYVNPALVYDDELVVPWVFVALKLEVEGALKGLLLLGRRDPDDYYDGDEIAILQSIADQTAVALVNITQAEQLRTLYQANIERQELERKSLALLLHDEVLNELANLAINSDTTSMPPRFHDGYQKITTTIRQMLSGLHPTMLRYGLSTGIEELVDDLTDRAGPNVHISTGVDDAGARYQPNVEQHMFRIVQQACENALKHANASHIRIIGNLNPGSIHLSVYDDGVGFSTEEAFGIEQVLSKRKFGLIGMQERAFMINAHLEIDSVPGRGTQVRISWNHQENQAHESITEIL